MDNVYVKFSLMGTVVLLAAAGAYTYLNLNKEESPKDAASQTDQNE
tara:strand:+ start:168 stop:305 length:138 start_codon:yes stop_codon:yes gene_type:complete